MISDLELKKTDSPPDPDKKLMNRGTTKGIQDFDRSRRKKLLRNNFLLVAILNFLTVSGLICCLAYYEWFYFERRIWVGLLYLLEDASGNFYRIPHFIEMNCGNGRESKEVCDILDKFWSSGKICTYLLSIGMFLHLVYFGSIVFLAYRSSRDDLDSSNELFFKPFIFKILSMILYLTSLIFWNLFNQTYERSGKIGISMYAGIVGCSIYLILLIYYGVLKKEMKNSVIIDNLLNPDKFLGSFREASMSVSIDQHNNIN